MVDTLPRFLDELVLRSQCWCYASIAGRHGFSVGANDAILLYLMLRGSVAISSASNQKVVLEPGDMVAVMDRRPHVIRSSPNCKVEELPFLNSAQYVDTPPFFSFGFGTADRQILCGRLKVRWPGNFRSSELPALIKISADESHVRFEPLLHNSRGKGAAAALTHGASLLLVSALQRQAEVQAQFGETIRDPISRAVKRIEDEPHRNWTVSSLASDVGMGRTVFATRFFAQTRRTPFDVLTEVRMKHALELLLQTELKLSEICERVGYRSESAFHRRFTFHFGVAPGKMRLTNADPALGNPL